MTIHEGCPNECPFDIWAPTQHTRIENLAFSSYAYTQQQLDDFAKALAQTDDPNDEWNQHCTATRFGINIDNLTSAQVEYLQEEVAKWC